MMALVVLILGVVLCAGDVAKGPSFHLPRASRQVGQRYNAKPLGKLYHGHPFRWPLTQVQRQRPHVLARQSFFSKVWPFSKPSKPPPTTSMDDVLDIRREFELQRSFGKTNAPPESGPLKPDRATVPGKLENGLTYVIYPNVSPPQRFEAHLEIMSGSADEEDRQQGMAHLVEHMTFLGSRKRTPLLGTGSKSNAFTDFHHTVFHVDCPLYLPGTKKDQMLPYALELFRDILESDSFDKTRFRKEQQAILSEAQMMNTIEYRVDCHILESLHKENRLSKRFPIGKEQLIQDWDLNEVKRFHRTHYRPTNVMLYVIGDLDTKAAEEFIRKSFDTLPSHFKDYEKIVEQATAGQQNGKFKVGWGQGRVGGYLPEDELGPLGEQIEPTMKLQSMHFPPVLHRWTGGEFDNSHAVPVSSIDLASTVAKAVQRSNPDALRARVKTSIEKMRASNEATDLTNPAVVTTLLADALAESIADAKHRLRAPKPEFSSESPYNVGLFHHQTLQSFTLHIYVKRPIDPIDNRQTLKKCISERIAITALQVRLSMKAKAKADVPFSFLESEWQDCPREGCNVGSLDFNCEGKVWREATAIAVMEVRRFGLYGITESEFQRYRKALHTNSAQAALLSQQGAVPNSEMMARLQESVACHHTWMDPQELHEACEEAMAQITKEEVDKVAYELTSHIVEFGKFKGEPLPSAIVGSVPPPVELTNEMVIEAIKDGVSRPVDPEPDVVVPSTLMAPEKIAEIVAENPPAWADDGPVKDETTGAIARKLENGIKVSYLPLPHEPNRGFLRIIAPGGRICERGPGGFGAAPGAASIGALTMQGGGYFDPWTRQQIELFMVDNLIQGQITCVEDALIVDMSFSTVPVNDAKVSGMEALLQFVNRFLTPGQYIWEPDAFERSKDFLAQHHEQIKCSLEGAASETLMELAVNQDRRFLLSTPEELSQVTLDEAKKTTLLQLNPSSLDIAIVGDIDVQETEKLILQYLGSVPKSDTQREEEGKALYMNEARAPSPAPAPPLPCPERNLRINVPDSEVRAAGYIVGPAPSRWGLLSDGRHIRDAVAALAPGPESNYSSVADRAAAAADYIQNFAVSSAGVDWRDRWAHPLFASVVIDVLQEVINSRLFQTVRDRKQLTYETSFRFTSYERVRGAYWMSYVTATPAKVDQALEACQEVFTNLGRDMTFDLGPSRRTLKKNHDTQLRSNAYWATILAGTQSDAWPHKKLGSVKDFYKCVDAVTRGDLMALVKVIGFGAPDKTYSCVAISGGKAKAVEQTDETGHSLPGVGHSRAKMR